MKEFLKTNRLLLRFFEETDLDDLFRLLSNPKVMTYLEPPFGKEKTKEFLFKYCLEDDPLLYALSSCRGYQDICIRRARLCSDLS